MTDGSVHLILCWLSWSYFSGPSLGEIHVLEPVGEGPAVGAADGERGDTGVVDRLRGRQQVLPGLGLRARVLEALALYQISDLLAALSSTPYCLPPTLPMSCQPCE